MFNRKFTFWEEDKDGVIISEKTGFPNGMSDRLRWYQEKVYVTYEELERILKSKKQ